MATDGRRSFVVSAVAMVVLAGRGTAQAETRHVPSPNYPTIQSAIDACADGDEVVIEPNTYTGPGNRDLDFGGRAITVRSTDPNDPNVVAATVIKCNPDDPNDPAHDHHRGFWFHNAEDANSVVAGLTITNGYIYDIYEPGVEDRAGASVYCDHSSPTITCCRITGGYTVYGGGIYAHECSPAISHCVITGCEAAAGGAIVSYDGSPMITHCTITGNTGEGYGGGITCTGGSPTIAHCTISENESYDVAPHMDLFGGGGVHSFHSTPQIADCTINGNFAARGGGILCVECEDSNLAIIDCNIIANTASTGSPYPEFDDARGGGIYCTSSSPTVTGCTITQNLSGHNGGGIGCVAQSSPAITDCTISDNSAEYRLGGGIYCDNSSPQITHCTISGNTVASVSSSWFPAGGGIQCSYGSPTITHCAIYGNTVTGEAGTGGGMTFRDSNPVISHCTISENEADYDGGGICCRWGGGQLTITHCTIVGNTSGSDGGGISWHGDQSTIAKCVIVGNTCRWNGGGLQQGGQATVADCVISGNFAEGSDYASGFGGGADVSECSSVSVANCIITGNQADYGGGIYSYGCAQMLLTGCTFAGNMAQTAGGIDTRGDVSPAISSCTFAGNVALWGGGIGCHNGNTPAITNCTISRNRAVDFGAGVLCESGSSPTLVNCIVWDNPAGRWADIVLSNANGASTLAVSYCDVEGGPDAVLVDPGCTLVWDPNTNIDAEPDFVGGGSGTWTAPGLYDPNTYQVALTDDAATWDDGELVGKLIDLGTSLGLQFVIAANTGTTITVWASADMVQSGASGIASGAAYRIYDYHLSPNSPCIDVGDLNGDYAGQTDIDGEPRVMNGRVDMGSDEYPACALTLTVNWDPLGTVDVDPDLPTYAVGAEVTLTAFPNDGYVFMWWLGDVPAANATDNPVQLLMDTDKNVYCVFFLEERPTCGGGTAPPLMVAIGLLGIGRLRRRRRIS